MTHNEIASSFLLCVCAQISQQDPKATGGKVSPTSSSSCSDEKAPPAVNASTVTVSVSCGCQATRILSFPPPPQANPSKPAQVPRSDNADTPITTPITPAVKGYKHKERKTPPTSKMTSRHSPKFTRKYTSAQPQLAAGGTDKGQSQKNVLQVMDDSHNAMPVEVECSSSHQEGNGGGGNAKLSYAQMAQKPKAPKPAGGDSSPPHDSPAPQPQPQSVGGSTSPPAEETPPTLPPSTSVSVPSD